MLKLMSLEQYLHCWNVAAKPPMSSTFFVAKFIHFCHKEYPWQWQLSLTSLDDVTHISLQLFVVVTLPKKSHASVAYVAFIGGFATTFQQCKYCHRLMSFMHHLSVEKAIIIRLNDSYISYNILSPNRGSFQDA